MYKNYPVVLNFTWNDYNGLVWGQEAYPVANKSEYIREGYALRKSSKDWSTRNRKKKTECFAKFIKRIRRGLKNIQLKFIVCVSYESDLQLNYTR